MILSVLAFAGVALAGDNALGLGKENMKGGKRMGYKIPEACIETEHYGEIRPYNDMNHCLDITGHDGIGEVRIDDCDGRNDQQFMFCRDGLIRNMQVDNCLEPEISGDKLTGRVFSQPCHYVDRHRWELSGFKRFEDAMGILQTGFVMKPKIGAGMVWEYGNSFSSENGDNNKQWWVFRSRGEMIDWGRLLSMADRTQVLDYIEETGDVGRVWSWDKGTDDMSQVYAEYENGEIVNQKSGLCLTMGDYDSQVRDVHCDGRRRQQWITDRDTQGPFFTLMNGVHSVTDREMCIKGGTQTAAEMKMCAFDKNQQDQYFEFNDDSQWTDPRGTWVKISCGESVMRYIFSSRRYSDEVSEMQAFNIGATLAEGIHWMGDLKISGDASEHLGHSFIATSDLEITYEAKCETYDNGESFDGGCLWQFKVDIDHWHPETTTLTWRPILWKCTRGDQPPQCPPFDKCHDAECSKCYAKKKSKKNKDRLPNHEEGATPTPTSHTSAPTVAYTIEGGETQKIISHDDLREKTKCKKIKKGTVCEGRVDCEPKMVRGVLKTCKPKKCSKIDTLEGCLKSNKKCVTVYNHREFDRCRKKKRSE